MSISLTAPAAQVCAFALGCTLIHAARAHAVAITKLLTGLVVVAAALVLIEAAVVFAPNPAEHSEEVSIYAALSLQSTGTESNER